MKFKLYYGISVFFVLMLVIALAYAVVTNFVTFDEQTLIIARYTITGVLVGTAMIWSCMSFFVNCPHCGDQALLYNMDRSKEPKIEKATPLILRPLSFMIDEEFFAGYCHCKSCHSKISFSNKNSKD